MNGKTPSHRTSPIVTALLCGLACTCTIGRAADHFLTIGGGSSPDNNQVSLEQNVLFFRDTLATLHLNKAPQEVLFADGNLNQHNVQYTPDDDQDVPKVDQLIADIFPNEGATHPQYRPHAIPNVWGPSQRTDPRAMV